MSETSNAPESEIKPKSEIKPQYSSIGLRAFINRAKDIRSVRNRGNKDAVLRAGIEVKEEQGMIDELTGLPNKRAFEEKLKEETERVKRTGRKAVIMMFDLDKLKEKNDKEGHEAGNEYLRSAAKSLKTGLRTTDFVARYGGDEFVAILPETDASLVRNIWDERLLPSTQQNGIFISAGADELNTIDPQTSLQNADHAMYGAKREPNKNGNLMFVKEPQAVNG